MASTNHLPVKMPLVLLKLSSRLNHFCFHHLNLLLLSLNQWLLQMLLSLNQWLLQMFLWSQMFPYNNPSLLLLPPLSRHRRDALNNVFPRHQRFSTYMVIKCRWAISLPYYVAITNSNRNYWFKNWGIGILSWPPSPSLNRSVKPRRLKLHHLSILPSSII